MFLFSRIRPGSGFGTAVDLRKSLTGRKSTRQPAIGFHGFHPPTVSISCLSSRSRRFHGFTFLCSMCRTSWDPLKRWCVSRLISFCNNLIFANTNRRAESFVLSVVAVVAAMYLWKSRKHSEEQCKLRFCILCILPLDL
jgi:hypothetical protein